MTEDRTAGAPRRPLALLLGPAAAASLLLFFDLAPGRPEVERTAAVALWMAIWWITEAVPLAVTSLLPVVLLPVLGVMDGKRVASEYFNDVVFLFLGGFLVALSIERWGLHRRIALRVLLLFGARPTRILLGFMVATALLSMWISNTATAMMMVTIVLAVVRRLEEEEPGEATRRFVAGLLIGVAWAASTGGISTLVGTPPNLSFKRIFERTFPDAPTVDFTSWMLFALPLGAVLLLVGWLLLSLVFVPRGRTVAIDREHHAAEARALGPVSR
ncbi:MAG: SLC13 family permease, partial [Planctomycetota bacterium JB042]